MVLFGKKMKEEEVNVLRMSEVLMRFMLRKTKLIMLEAKNINAEKSDIFIDQELKTQKVIKFGEI